MTFPSFFDETLLESLRDSHSPGQEFHFFDSKITHFHFFHTCTAFWLQKFITKSQNGVQRSHFGLQSGPRRARPAGRAWPARAGQPGRPVLPAGARLAPTWRAGGLLPGKGTREELRRGRSAQELMEPPHSYHRRWVIWYYIDITILKLFTILKIFSTCIVKS